MNELLQSDTLLEKRKENQFKKTFIRIFFSKIVSRYRERSNLRKGAIS